jgi:hypothetical protein
MIATPVGSKWRRLRVTTVGPRSRALGIGLGCLRCFRDLGAPLPWWRLGFDGKALLEAGFFAYLLAVLLA